MSKADPKKPDTDPELKGLFDTIGSVELGARSEAIGRIMQISDGLAEVSGLGAARLGELLEFENGSRAFVLNLETELIQAVLLDSGEGVVNHPVDPSGKAGRQWHSIHSSSLR